MPKKETQVRLGDRVRVRRKLVRQWVERPEDAAKKRLPWFKRGDMKWVPEWIDGHYAPVEGIVTGVRYLQEGYTEPGWSGTPGSFRDDAEPPYWVSRGNVHAVMVTFNLYRNPIPVLQEDLEYLGGQ